MARKLKKSKVSLMSVTIRPGFAMIPLAENGFGMDFSAFSSERAHK
jgi:hypothetical protein